MMIFNGFPFGLRRRLMWIALVLLPFVLPLAAYAYPLDGYDYTGIRRLEFYRLAQEGEVRGRQLHEGAQLPMEQVRPRWQGPVFSTLPSPDPEKSRQLARLLGHEADRYGVALLDLTNPDQAPSYIAHNDQMKANVGSVGKLLVAVALFQQLAEHYPQIEQRERVLRETQVEATGIIHYDHHKVPFWDVQKRRLQHRPLRVGDRGTLWEYLDWTLSASSNAAAAMVMRELLLLAHFEGDYPVPESQAQVFLQAQSAHELGRLLKTVMDYAVRTNGLDPDRLRQGSFFTRAGKRQVAGIRSYATPAQLVQLLYRLESGTLVDRFSSRELKRLLYMTQRRIRYASHPAMSDDAIYFKSGSLYSCRPEPGFRCGKYRGNRVNRLASVAIVESPADQPRYHYLVVVMSNVLRKNSAVAHQRLALKIQHLIEDWHTKDETAGVLWKAPELSAAEGERP